MAIHVSEETAPVAAGAPKTSSNAAACRRKFLRFFRGGFYDPTYLAWERGYKWTAHRQWNEGLHREEYRALLSRQRFDEIAARAVRLESRANLLFSFEKMALRDALRVPSGARPFALGLYELIYGTGGEKLKFERWCEAVKSLPRRQTRVLTWPVVTVFPFIALPGRHIFLKPNVTRIAARTYGYDFGYQSRPSWTTYASLLEVRTGRAEGPEGPAAP